MVGRAAVSGVGCGLKQRPNQQQYLFLYIISLLLFSYIWCVVQCVASKVDFSFS